LPGNGGGGVALSRDCCVRDVGRSGDGFDGGEATDWSTGGPGDVRDWWCDEMRVTGQVGRQQRNGFRAGRFADDGGSESGAGALVDGNTALQVGQVEVRASITAVGGADQRKQSVVLGDRQGLSIAEC